jgi:hypothetical protein
MFVPHRKHMSPRSVAGKALHFILHYWRKQAESRVMRIFGLKRGEIFGWGKFCNEKLHIVGSSPNTSV